MNNLKLRETTRKLIKPCTDCGGSGTVTKGHEKDDSVKVVSQCPSCLGKGYIDELEFGCEIKYKNGDGSFIYCGTAEAIAPHWSPWTYVGMNKGQCAITGELQKHRDTWENLGKPLELNELLEALEKKVNYNFTYGIVNTWICEIDNINKTFQEVFEYDLKLNPEQQPEEVIKKLIEILK